MYQYFKNYKIFIMLSIVAFVPLLTFIIPESYYHQIFYIHPFIRIVDFIVGIIVFNIYRSYSNKDFIINYDFLEISALLLLLIFFLCHQWIPQVALYSFYYWLPMSYLIFSFSFFSSLLVRWSWCSWQRRGWRKCEKKNSNNLYNMLVKG